ncbi:MAG: ABC transporter substrate-binding protein [Actinobacteria bacterium]|nr:ABC transporter substrate-binding protein [Actinomycetota bacterium]
MSAEKAGWVLAQSIRFRRESLLCLVLCVAVVLGASISACSNSKPIHIGYLGGLTGGAASLGLEGREGVTLAIDAINEAGGIGGRQIELIVRNGSQDATTAKKAVRELVEEGCVAIIGPMTSSLAEPVAAVAAEEGIAVISPTVSTDEMTGRADAFFRVYPDNSSAARELASIVKKRPGVTTISVLYDTSNSAHTVTWMDYFSTAFEATFPGGVLARVPFASENAIDFQQLASQVALGNPNALLILANSRDTGLACQRVRATGYDGLIVTSEWSSTEDVIAHGGHSVEGVLFLSTFDRDSTYQAYLDVAARCESRYGHELGFAGVHGYECAQILATVFETSTERAAVLAQLSAPATYDCIQGSLELDAHGDVVRPYYLSTVSEGKLVGVR